MIYADTQVDVSQQERAQLAAMVNMDMTVFPMGIILAERAVADIIRKEDYTFMGNNSESHSAVLARIFKLPKQALAQVIVQIKKAYAEKREIEYIKQSKEKRPVQY